MNTVTQTMKFRQSLLSYAEKYGVTQAAIKYNVNRQYFELLILLSGLSGHRQHCSFQLPAAARSEIFSVQGSDYVVPTDFCRSMQELHNDWQSLFQSLQIG